MKSHKIILFGLSLLFCQSCSSQKVQVNNNSISISIPSIEEEATSIWRTINDIKFFESQGYRINLPENDLIQSLKEKSKNGNFGNEDYPQIYNVLEESVYAKSNYEPALKKVQAQKQLINELVDDLYKSKETWDWRFKPFENYKVVFTLYGTGGSYNPDSGMVTLFTTPEGKFMNYEEPANTIIHEIIHMGIEESIVQKYNLSHGVKERIVDIIVSILFKDSLPNYKIQNMGDAKIDKFLRNKKDLKELDSVIKKFLSQNK